jgi:FkbM family methyltransferase
MTWKFIRQKIQESRYVTGLRELRRDIVFGPSVARDIRDNEKMKLLYAYILRKNSNCIDIGAHFGTYLKLFNFLAPFGRHIAFEPIPNLATYLLENFKQNIVHNVALGNSSGQASFFVVKGLESWSGLRKTSYPGKYSTEQINVRLEKLDNIVPHGYYPYLVKIDVEGAEYDVMQGAVKLFHSCKPFIVYEHSARCHQNYDVSHGDIWNLLSRDLKYRIFTINGVGPLSLQQYEDVICTSACINFIAHD